jgi:hypothetical protein
VYNLASDFYPADFKARQGFFTSVVVHRMVYASRWALTLRRKPMKFILAIISLLLTAPAFAAESTSKSMSFDQCLLVIQRTATQLGVAPINIVETSIMRMVRFPTADGSVLVTCSKPDQKMVMTISKN